MTWHMGISEIPGKPFAVINTDGSIAGCHASREAASLQLSTLLVNGVDPDVPLPTLKDGRVSTAPNGGAAEAPQKPASTRELPPVMYTTPTSQAW